MKKSSIARYLLSSACALSLIGTGFAFWQFDGVFGDAENSFKLNGNVEGACVEGDLKVLLPKGYTTFNLILEQANSIYSTQDENGVRFVPYININYKNYIYNENVKAKLKAEVTFNNKALENYVVVINSVEDTVKNSYVFLDEFIDLSAAQEYKRMIVPLFGYNVDKMPVKADDFKNMIEELNLAKQTEYDLTVSISIDFVV